MMVLPLVPSCSCAFLRGVRGEGGDGDGGGAGGFCCFIRGPRGGGGGEAGGGCAWVWFPSPWSLDESLTYLSVVLVSKSRSTYFFCSLGGGVGGLGGVRVSLGDRGGYGDGGGGGHYRSLSLGQLLSVGFVSKSRST